MAGGSAHPTPAPDVYLPLAHAAHSLPALVSKPASHSHADPSGVICALLGHCKAIQSPKIVLPGSDIVPTGHTSQAPFPVAGLYWFAGHAHAPKADSSSKWRQSATTTNRYLPTALQFTVTVAPLPLGVNAHSVFNAESKVDPSPTLMLALSKRWDTRACCVALLTIITEESLLVIPKSTNHQESGLQAVWKKSPVNPSMALEAGLPNPLARNDD